ncbi:Sbal_3080 family lipoprotein [Shewanella violacea]|uniref:Type IV secretion system putative lipoprotein virB7 n=1 Tax=Shewanella violacea (strain JCM 10179 / CIP 106290 / LMG 19151 / DSS12) TaxID=637905 RepID=D4ZJB8_SHEVD|nr:Sbal_3080 family lipoprotein [Shewanella violacea]BAJ01767.1 hypothetical protein SVI_1796 [Shewanella violacea DSS12]
MKKIVILLTAFLALTGCSSNGISNLKQMDANFDKQIVMIDDSKQTASVRSIVTNWIKDHGYDVADTTASTPVQLADNQVLFKFNANWWWDMATYMRYVNLEVTDNKGTSIAKLDFDSVQYGGIDKFGNAEERLNIIMEVFFKQISIKEAEHDLEYGRKSVVQ